MAINITDLDEQRQVSRNSESESRKSEPDNNAEAREELKQLLIRESRQHEWLSRRKSILAHLFFGTAIAASALGMMNPATKWLVGDAWTSGLAAIPGIVLLIMNTFKYDARFKWHKLKQQKMEALYRGLVYEGKTVKETSELLTKTLDELEKLRVDLQAPSIK